MNNDLYSLDSEQGVLGSVFNECQVLEKIVAELEPEDFFTENHQLIFQAMQDAADLNPGGPVDAVMVRDALVAMGKLGQIGGVGYLVEVHEHACGTGTLPYDIGVLKTFRARRQAAAIGTRLIGAGLQEGIEDVISEAKASLEKIAVKENKESEELCDAVPDAVEAMLSATPGLETGMRSLDWTLSGMHAGQLIIVGARPSVGKTAFVLSIILHLIKQGIGVMLLSLEMAKCEIVQRLICMDASVSLALARHGEGGLSDEEIRRVTDSGNRMMEEKWPLYIVEAGGVTADSLGIVVVRERRRHKVELLVVDYLQLMPPSRATAKENRTSQITELSRSLKLLAMTEGIPVLAVSQLNRAPEARRGHMPRLSDLRESGAIEQDADVVMLLYREDYCRQAEKDYQPNNEMTVLTAKHRNGPTGCVKLNFHKEYILVTNRATDEETAGRV